MIISPVPQYDNNNLQYLNVGSRRIVCHYCWKFCTGRPRCEGCQSKVTMMMMVIMMSIMMMMMMLMMIIIPGVLQHQVPSRWLGNPRDVLQTHTGDHPHCHHHHHPRQHHRPLWECRCSTNSYFVMINIIIIINVILMINCLEKNIDVLGIWQKWGEWALHEQKSSRQVSF